MGILRQSSTLLLLHVAAGGLLGRVDLVGLVDAVLVALVRLRRVEAGLHQVRLALRRCQERCATLCSTYLNQILSLCLRDEGL